MKLHKVLQEMLSVEKAMMLVLEHPRIYQNKLPSLGVHQGAIKLVSVVSRILDTMRMVRHWIENNAKFPLTPMGVLAPRSAHARPSARPPSI